MSQQTATTLRSRGLRVTPQRRAIWGAFAGGAGEHLSADEIFRRARRNVPELSRATVYNALGEFVAAGLLGLVEAPGPQLYDVNLEPHHHFRCRCCRRLYDVEPAGVDSLRLDRRGFRVERAQVLLQGICPSCSAEDGAHKRASRQTSRGTPAPG
jgi:Fur family transcriptional regulator, stress-responsive regulator